MADGGTIKFQIHVEGYWQTCPVCGGCCSVPSDFYDRLGATTNLARLPCRRCSGTGTIAVPLPAELRTTGKIEP